jgi:hypothetical protein
MYFWFPKLLVTIFGLAWANGRGRIEQGRKTKNNPPQDPPQKEKIKVMSAGAEFWGHCKEEDSMTKLEESQVVNLTICYHVVYYRKVLHLRVRGITSRH